MTVEARVSDPAPAAVDVILPTWARPHTLPYALESVLRQTVSQFTLHVVCDGCDERTESAVRSLSDRRLRFHRFPKARGFGYASRNEVLRATAAPYVAYMTDDDLWFPDHLERGISELEARGLGLVAFRSGQVRFPDVADPYFFAYDWRTGAVSTLIRNWFTGSVNCVHRRSVFDVVGYWDDGLVRFGDREFYNRVRASSVPSAYVDEITVLRFYAQQWDRRYGVVERPPQERYLPKLNDPDWCREFRAAAAGRGRRGPAVRRRQWADFLAFGWRSGPRLLRFLWEKWKARHRP